MSEIRAALNVSESEVRERVKVIRAGRRWAATHPYAEPEEYEAKAAKMASERAQLWLQGVLCEYWRPTLDEHGRRLPDTRDL